MRLSDEEIAHFERALQAHRDVIHPDVIGRSTFTERVTFVQMEAMVSELRARRAADLTHEDRHWLSLIPSVIEVVYQRADLESVVNGSQPPKRENIDKTIAALNKVLARAEGK